MTPESRLKNAVMKRLAAVPNSFALKIHGSMFSQAGTPDVLFWRQGRLDPESWAFELKVPGNQPTKIQLHRHEEMRHGGVVVVVAYSVADVVAALGLK